MTNDREQKLQELKNRIAQLRARIEQPVNVPSVQGVHLSEETKNIEQNVDTTGSLSRISQADDFKAKLLGLKK